MQQGHHSRCLTVAAWALIGAPFFVGAPALAHCVPCVKYPETSMQRHGYLLPPN